MIQIKNLKIEVEKGFRRTLFEPELVDPNLEINSVKNISLLLKLRDKENIHLTIEREMISMISYVEVKESGATHSF